MADPDPGIIALAAESSRIHHWTDDGSVQMPIALLLYLSVLGRQGHVLHRASSSLVHPMTLVYLSIYRKLYMH